MTENFGNNIKKVILMGIGAMASTAEKSKELVDELVKKGELTVEQGKTLNEELKHTIRENVDNVKESVVKAIAPEKEPKKAETGDDIVSRLDKMSAEELEAIKSKLTEIEKSSSEDDK